MSWIDDHASEIAEAEWEYEDAKMKSPKQTMAEIRDELAASRIVNPTLTVLENARNSYAKGWDARDQLDETALRIAIEALEDYANQDGYYDRPYIAQEALAEIRKIRKGTG